MPDLVFEIGTEEMPAGAVGEALNDLRDLASTVLAEQRLPPASISVYGTPRRLVLYLEQVPEIQPNQIREVRGPARSIAFDKSGAPTGAALGFAKKQGVSVDSLESVTVGDSEYVLARVTDQGRPSAEVLPEALSGIVKRLTFPKMMRWGDQREGGVRFVRPLRWLLCLLGDQAVPVCIGDVTAGRETRGHRFLSPEPFDVAEAPDLFQMLHMAGVMLDPEERRQGIVAQSNLLAAEVGGRVPWDSSLLDENVFLVEWPTALRGDFDPAFLELPRPVLVTAMKKHQRFFPIEDSDGKLLPHFISIRNGGEDYLDTVRLGNERVLTARFADASYFYAQDRDTNLDDMAADLGRLVFQEKLGTIAAKRERLVSLVTSLSGMLGFDEATTSRSIRAAELCKADLVSRMVVELPSLQGVMGREYALSQGESSDVADAIAQHYQPRSAGDSIPESPIGRLLAVADRLDTLVGYAGIGVQATGSSDPYGLRRAAQGVVQILSDEPEMPSLGEIVGHAASEYKRVNGLELPIDSLIDSLTGIINQRISTQLEERGVRYDLIDAAISAGAGTDVRVYATVRRGEALQSISGDGDFVAATQAAARVANILRSAPPAEHDTAGELPLVNEDNPGGNHQPLAGFLERKSRNVDRSLLQEASEMRLYSEALALIVDVARHVETYDFLGLYRGLGRLRDPINSFFDEIMVMVDDVSVRKNRLAVLQLVDSLFKLLADFTKVVIA